MEGLGKWKRHIKFSSRPTRKAHCGRLGFGPAAAQLNTVKHYAIARRGKFVIISRGSQTSFNFWCCSPWNGNVQWRNVSSRVVCCDNRSYVSTLGELCELRCRGLKEAQVYTNYIANLYSHRERNVMAQRTLQFRGASYILWVSFACSTIIKYIWQYKI